jgi:hypothetical protein
MTAPPERDVLLASWGPRPPDAARTARFLRELSALPGWSPLSLPPAREDEPPVPLDLREAAVAQLLQDQRDHDDFGNLMAHPGASFHVWNGTWGDHELSCYLRVGETSEWVGNCVSVGVPLVATPGTNDEAAEILRVVVDVWRPDHAWTGPIDFALEQQPSGKGTVGRLTYVPHPGPLPQLPAPVTAEPLADGVLLTIHADDGDLAPEVVRLRQILLDAGVLRLPGTPTRS